MRRDLKVKKWVDVVGAVLALIGWGGICGAVEGQGNPIVAIIVFSIGFGICLVGYRR